MIASSFRLCGDEKEMINTLAAKISRLMNLRNREMFPGEVEEMMLLVEEIATLAERLNTLLKNPIPAIQNLGVFLLEDNHAATPDKAEGGVAVVSEPSEYQVAAEASGNSFGQDHADQRRIDPSEYLA